VKEGSKMVFTRQEKQAFDYFYKGDKADIFVQNLDCYSADIYFILKYKYHLTEKTEAYFIDDISYALTMQNGVYKEIVLNRQPEEEWVYDITMTAPETDRYEAIKKLVEEQDFVMVETYCHRLKSSFLYTREDEYYNPNFDKTRRDHCFMVIDYDEEGLHIVDEEILVKAEYLEKICPNKSIYHMKKERILPALDAMCNLYTVTLKQERIEKNLSEDFFIGLLKRTYENYQRDEYQREGITYYPGIKGLKKLLELIEQDNLPLEEKTDKEGTMDLKGMQNVIGDLTWKLWCIEQKRFVLIESMKWRKEERFASFKKMLKKNFRIWNKLRSELLEERETKKKKMEADKVILLKNLIESEELLIQEMESFVKNRK